MVMAGLLGLLLGLFPTAGAQAATHSIAGRITVPAGFNAQQVTVILDDQNGTVASTNPDVSGDYGFSAIPDGTYRVRAYGPDLTTESTAYFALSSNIRGKNLTLFELFTVSGTVTPASTGLVYFYDSCAAFQAGTPRAQGSITGGTYSAEVPAGNYRVLIASEIASWHYGELSCHNANDVTVTGDLSTPLLGVAPVRIKGRVTYKGAGVDGAFVSARRWDGVEWKPVAFAQTAADGTYTISNLLPGTYRIRFDSVQYGSRQLPGNWWEDAQTLQAATDIKLTAGATAQGIDAAMIEGASISGTVSGPTGPRAGAIVRLFDASGTLFNGRYTEADGTWKIDGLWPGSYKVSFEDADGSNQEFWNDKPTLEQADSFTVANLENRTGLDAWLGGPDPCEFQKTCPAPPAPTAADQQVKAPPKSLKRGKRAKLATSTAQGGPVGWKTTTKKICKVKKNRVLGLKKGKCVLRATSPATTGFTPLYKRYTIRIR
jgi:hypothetical protein